MELAVAKIQAEAALRRFVGVELSTEVLNDIENAVNSLIWTWMSLHSFLVRDHQGRIVAGIKLWFDHFDGRLRTRFRYNWR